MNRKEALIIMLVGIFLLLLNLGFVTRDYIVFFVGLGLLLLHVIHKDAETIVPGCIVSSIGLYFVLRSHFDIPSSIFLVFLGMGFLAIFVFDRKQGSWPLYPGLVLTFLGSYRQLSTTFNLREYREFIFPGILIIIGLVFFVNSFRKGK